MHGKVVAVRPQALQRRKESRQAVAVEQLNRGADMLAGEIGTG